MTPAEMRAHATRLTMSDLVPHVTTPSAVGDPALSPRVRISPEHAEVAGIRDRGDRETPDTPDLIAIRERAHRAHEWLLRDQRATTGDDWLPLTLRTHFEHDVPMLLAEVDQARAERDKALAELAEERAKVEVLLLGDTALQSRIWLGEECQRLRAERNRMRPVVEAAQKLRGALESSVGMAVASGAVDALVVAVDGYETAAPAGAAPTTPEEHGR